MKLAGSKPNMLKRNLDLESIKRFFYACKTCRCSSKKRRLPSRGVSNKLLVNCRIQLDQFDVRSYSHVYVFRAEIFKAVFIFKFII